MSIMGIPKNYFFVWIACIIVLLLTTGCEKKTSTNTEVSIRHTGMIELLLDSSCVADAQLFSGPGVQSFYSNRMYSFAWFDHDGLLPAGNTMLYLIRSAHIYGLLPSDYHIREIQHLLDQPGDGVTQSQLDILLTDSFLAMHYHLKYGRLDSEYKRVIQLFGIDTSAVDALTQALPVNAIQQQLAQQEPHHTGYHQLKQSLNKLYDTVHINTLAPPHEYIASLTPEALLISVNMERWRWEPPCPDRYAWINIPAYQLDVYDHDTIALTSPVIVGTSDTPTPIITSRISCFIIYPYWTVPRKIATEEILPHLRRDSTYLTRHNYDLLNNRYQVLDTTITDWSVFSKNNFPFVLRQREGWDNTLGVIKFIFNNPYGVYLHDTNARGLFRRTSRALSHGCIRMEKARELAYYLTKNDVRYTREDIDQYFSLHTRLEISLIDPIPIYTRYFTVEVRDKATHFLPDIYQQDQRLITALYHGLAPTGTEISGNDQSLFSR